MSQERETPITWRRGKSSAAGNAGWGRGEPIGCSRQDGELLSAVRREAGGGRWRPCRGWEKSFARGQSLVERKLTEEGAQDVAPATPGVSQEIPTRAPVRRVRRPQAIGGRDGPDEYPAGQGGRIQMKHLLIRGLALSLGLLATSARGQETVWRSTLAARLIRMRTYRRCHLSCRLGGLPHRMKRR